MLLIVCRCVPIGPVAPQPPLPLPEVQSYVDVLHLMRFCYNEPWVTMYFAKLNDAVRRRLEILTDEELKVCLPDLRCGLVWSSDGSMCTRCVAAGS